MGTEWEGMDKRESGGTEEGVAWALGEKREG